ncbi:MAG: uroporphyrinogen-III synthase [Euryarchaeota archaeon]|nr:uroporphyrinogen-III synthase [Euryarchaeota archaeon]
MKNPVIAIMRPDMHLDSSIALLRSHGFDVIAAPMIELRDNYDSNFDGFVERILACESDTVIFTSSNGIAFMMRKIDDPERFVHALNQTSVVAIGSKTKSALETRGINVALVPDSYSSKGIAAMLHGIGGRVIEVVRSTHGDPALIAKLESFGDGVLVHETAVYSLVLPDDGRQQRMIEDALNGTIDIFAFTSAMTVHNFMTVARSMGTEARIADILCERVVAAIGDPTAEVLFGYGVSVDVMPDKFTFRAMIDALEEHIR